MRKISLRLKNSSYDIIIGSGAIKLLPKLIKNLGFTGPLVIIIDSTILQKHKNIVIPVLNSVNNKQHIIKVKGHERTKSISGFSQVVTSIAKNIKMHSPMIIAIGGGVTGDLAGFIASIYRRGVPIIQIPTTLLSQVDSSIGGKTGIDLAYAKNIIGSFKQPECVICDTTFLSTLPEREISNGMAEVVKYGIIKNPGILKLVESNIQNIFNYDQKILEEIVFKCAAIKAEVVKLDEYDKKNTRIILNYGHTIGHAIEAASGYGAAYTHGEAISIGMVIAGHLAVKLNIFTELSLGRIKKILTSLNLPITVKNVNMKKILDSYTHDKKFISGINRFVLPDKIGHIQVTENIPEELIIDTIKENSSK